MPGFLKAKSRGAVDEVMRRKVIPLIAEYFYDDWEKVRAVLGGTDAFVQGEKLEPPPNLDGGGEKRYRWTVREPFPAGAYEELIAGENELRQSNTPERPGVACPHRGRAWPGARRHQPTARCREAGGAPLEAPGRCRPEAHREGETG